MLFRWGDEDGKMLTIVRSNMNTPEQQVTDFRSFGKKMKTSSTNIAKIFYFQ